MFISGCGRCQKRHRCFTNSLLSLRQVSSLTRYHVPEKLFFPTQLNDQCSTVNSLWIASYDPPITIYPQYGKEVTIIEIPNSLLLYYAMSPPSKKSMNKSNHLRYLLLTMVQYRHSRCNIQASILNTYRIWFLYESIFSNILHTAWWPATSFLVRNLSRISFLEFRTSLRNKYKIKYLFDPIPNTKRLF